MGAPLAWPLFSGPFLTMAQLPVDTGKQEGFVQAPWDSDQSRDQRAFPPLSLTDGGLVGENLPEIHRVQEEGHHE